MQEIIEMSSSTTWLKAVCNECNQPATYSHRNGIDSESQVLIGDSDQYQALCEKCFKNKI